ncbi:ribonuclease III domain-containing protein [Aspergillus ambiguus]|uniref:ribonuclease III n=1 Tax=Aspergillus ambiguus TaxID=176160 RepID=UPI003CCE37B2
MNKKRKSVFSTPSEGAPLRPDPKVCRLQDTAPTKKARNRHGYVPHVDDIPAPSGPIRTEEVDKSPCSDLVGNSVYPPALPPVLDTTLERAVFTHPAMTNDVCATYDRLEILGDAYIELIATKFIWNTYQGISSGQISQIRELLVKNETLAEYATIYSLDRKASVPQEYLTQPKRWTKTKGDIFEAYAAAAILSDPENGYQNVEKWLIQLWAPKLSGRVVQPQVLNAKESLAKKIMGKHVKLKYVDEREPIQPEKGRQTFFIGVYLTGWGWDNKHLGSGQGPSKAVAGNEAAQRALQNDSLINDIVSVKKANESNKKDLQ